MTTEAPRADYSTVWAVREYTMYGDVEVFETLSAWATEDEAKARVA